MTTPTEVDVIIIGGGAAGCVVAGRLAAADPTLKITIVEAGRNNLEDPNVIKPGMCRTHLAPNATAMKIYTGNPSENLAGRSPIIPVAQILGGGSSVNYMMYTRASASDYDDWNAEGWKSEDLLPLLKKCESYFLDDGKSKTHGFAGPLAVSHGGYPVRLTDELLKAVQDKGYNIVDDAQDLKTSNAFARWAKWIDPATGRRSDAAHGYIHPQMARNPNLHLLVNSTVSKIIIKGGKATGIEYIPTVATEGGTLPLTPQKINARKLIVLSAGALSSPRILELSGVGAKTVLEAAGVTPIVDLPGVGMNYQDHNLLISVYKFAENAETCDDLSRLNPDVLSKAEAEFLEGKGILTTNFVDVGGKLRPTEKELTSSNAAFQEYWKDHFEKAEDKPVVFSGMINGFVGNHSLAGLTEGKYISIINIALYPASRGFIHIKSSDPYANPEFDPSFLSHPADLAPLSWSYKLSRELVRRMPSYRGEVQVLHPQFPPGSAASVEAVSLGDIATREDLTYTEEDNKAIEQFCKMRVTSTWHGLGTLAMKPLEDGGAVDSELNVYGVANLKVADLSICPSNVGSNTYSTALAIGEKCAILCGAYLGLLNVEI